MPKKSLAYVLSAVVLLIVVGLGWFFYVDKIVAQTIDKDTTINGDYTITKRTVFKNGARLTVTGNLDVQQELDCVNGPINIAVNGNLSVTGNINCIRTKQELVTDKVGNGLSVSAAGSINFDKSVKVTTNGSVQLTDSPAKIVTTQDKIDAIYNNVGVDSGSGKRVGPFVASAKPSSSAPYGVVVADAQMPQTVIPELVVPEIHHTDFNFFNVAQAQVPPIVPVQIGGTWIVGDGKIPPGQIVVPTPHYFDNVNKIIVNFDFGPDHNVRIQDLDLTGPDGLGGPSDIGGNCEALGDDGKDAMRLNVQASNLTINNFDLHLGSGGNGGDAKTGTSCDPASAKGGKGGQSGNFKIIGADNFDIEGAFNIDPGYGGDGGSAIATGKKVADTGCPGETGAVATATGGVGSDEKKDLSSIGSVSGLNNVKISQTHGGWGGNAEAYGGNGGPGDGCSCAGGNGGLANSSGGNGGNASLKVFGGQADSFGGNGGNIVAVGGNGGQGGQGGLTCAGGNGGNGGAVFGLSGLGGSGATERGNDGKTTTKKGGDGGNGGSGCGPGDGGKGYVPLLDGTPGLDGKPGSKTCPPVNTNTSTATPPPVEPDIQVVNANGILIPRNQLIVGGDAPNSDTGCGALHWHAANEFGVTSCDGQFMRDPGPQCGYCKLSECAVETVPKSKCAHS